MTKAEAKQRKFCSDLLFELEKVESRERRVQMLLVIGRQFFLEGMKWAIGPAMAFGLVVGAALGAMVAK